MTALTNRRLEAIITACEQYRSVAADGERRDLIAAKDWAVAKLAKKLVPMVERQLSGTVVLSEEHGEKSFTQAGLRHHGIRTDVLVCWGGWPPSGPGFVVELDPIRLLRCLDGREPIGFLKNTVETALRVKLVGLKSP